MGALILILNWQYHASKHNQTINRVTLHKKVVVFLLILFLMQPPFFDVNTFSLSYFLIPLYMVYFICILFLEFLDIK